MVEVAQGRLCNLRALLGLGMLIAMNLYACGAVRPNVLIILTDYQGWGIVAFTETPICPLRISIRSQSRGPHF